MHVRPCVRRACRARRGMALQLAFGAIVISTLMILMYFWFVQNQTRENQTVLERESAYHLARAGLGAGIAYFQNTARFSKLASMLMTQTCTSIGANPPGELLPEPWAPLEAVKSVIGGGAAVHVTLQVQNLVPYDPPDPTSGVQPDPIEKHGTLQVRATATVCDNTGGLSVYHTRCLSAYKEFRIVNVLPPIVSKFTLFVASRDGTASPNLITWSKMPAPSTDPTGSPATASIQTPLFLRNDSPENPRSSLETRGWVYLSAYDDASGNYAPYRLNLAWGQHGWGDQFQVLTGPIQFTSDGTDVRDSVTTFPKWVWHHGLHQGVFSDWRFKQFDPGQPTSDPVGDGVSILHPYGAPKGYLPAAETDIADASPTIVLGGVYRRYLTRRGLHSAPSAALAATPCVTACPACPFVQPSTVPDWTAYPAPAPWINTCDAWPQIDPFTAGPDEYPPANPTSTPYTPYMCNVVSSGSSGSDNTADQVYASESYNRGADYILSQPYTPTPTASLPVEPVEHLQSPNRVRSATQPANGEFLYQPDVVADEVYTITTRGGALLLGPGAGAGLHGLTSTDLTIANSVDGAGKTHMGRAVFCADAANFPIWVQGRHTVPGIMYFQSGASASGAVTIDQPLSLQSGGIVAVDGDITISAGISSPTTRPLSLVSLGGNVVINTTEPIHASLVALSRGANAGTLRVLTGPIAVYGGVAVRHVEWGKLAAASGSPGAIHKIVYDPRLDPTDVDAPCPPPSPPCRPNLGVYDLVLSPWRSEIEEVVP